MSDVIDITAAREELASAITAAVDPKVAVYPQAVDGLSTFPAVVLGMPSWKPGPTFCLNIYEFPVAVIVARPGISDVTTVTELDQLWPLVLDGLSSIAEQDPSFTVSRAEFGLFALQGQQYPAQIIFCSFTG